MSVAVSQAPGDVLYRIHTPAVVPSSNPIGIPVSSPLDRAGSDTPSSANDTSANEAARRLSAGAAYAEAVGIDLNAIGKGTSWLDVIEVQRKSLESGTLDS